MTTSEGPNVYVTYRRLLTSVATSGSATILAVALAASAVEAWTRITWKPLQGVPGFYLSDPVRIQRLAPGYAGSFAGVPVKINQLELRDDREYSLDKATNTFRILVLGDSVTFGHGSLYQHTYPYLLEQKLRNWRPDIDWQIWNAAVPGYNTSQELAQLLQVGSRFQPDLVVVGFYLNDVVDNFPVAEPSRIARLASAGLSFLYRHVYSIELYKRMYLQVAWKMSASNTYRLRLEHVSAEEALLANLEEVQTLKEQQLTPFERLTDNRVASIECRSGPVLDSDLIPAIKRERSWPYWLDAVRRFQQLHRAGAYRVVFFINIAPLVCPTADVFYDGGSADLNRFYLGILGSTTPVVSTYDEFRHLRPSQMPLAAEHAIGNSNLVKADILFRYLRDDVFPSLSDSRSAAMFQARTY